MTHTARKRFGQNFLHDHAIIHAIIASLNVQPKEHWLEIGPGQGALTEPLLKQDIELEVIELDRDLVALLENKYNSNPKLCIHSADALKFDYSALVKAPMKLRIIGNLPYNISTPLLFHLLKFSDYIEDMHFMLQKEVVDRICATPDSKKYGRLTVMMQYFCAAELLFNVPPTSFTPQPQVMSAIIRLEPHITPPAEVKDLTLLNRVVTQAFSQRRKTLRNSLKELITETQMQDLNIDPTLRAENLSLKDFALLSNLLTDSLPATI